MTGGPEPQHPAQAHIVAVLAQRPGLCVQDLAGEVGLTRTATLYHLRRLIKSGKVVSVRQGRRLTHFPASIRESSQHTLLGLMQVRTARLLVEQLAQEPTLSWRRLARRLGITPRAVRWHVQRLKEDRLLQVHEDHGARHVTILDDGLRALLSGGTMAASATGSAMVVAPLMVAHEAR